MAKRAQTPTANQPQTGHPPKINPIDPEVTVKPNPCAPPADKEKEKDCKCPAPPAVTSDEPRHPRNPRRPADDCCKQLISILEQIPGLQLPPIHKPKQKPSKKAMRLCETFGIRDAFVPLVDALWRRFEAGQPGRNNYEKAVMVGFGKFTKRERTDMHDVLEKYRKARASGQVECLFNDCLADAAEKGPIAGEWIFDQVINEGLAFAAKRFFSDSDGAKMPGQVRIWDDKLQRPDAPEVVFTGPWPWLTAIRTNLSTHEEYGNIVSYRPVPPNNSHHFGLNYQFAQTCTITMNLKGEQTANCVRETPPPPVSGSFSGGFCKEGGRDYTVGNECLRLPLAGAGSTIKLRGFNFITPTVIVRLRKEDDPSVSVDLECMVFGDAVKPVKDGSGKVIADESVSDGVLVPIPTDHPKISGAPFPAGNYSLTVLVNNVTGVSRAGAVPAQLETNRLLIRIEPDKNVKYTLWSERGRCLQETWGGGADEIWFDAYIGQIFPRDAAPDAPFVLKTEKREFPREPWSDMDSMEWASAYRQGLFGPEPFGLGGGLVVGMIGYEVDDEDSAKEQIQDFGKAFLKGLKEVFIPGVGSEVGRELLKAIGFSAGMLIAVVTIVIMIAVAWLWATWAPADLIALDLFTFDALTAWDATDPQKPIPPETRFNYQKGILPWTREPSIMTVIHSPSGKDPGKPGSLQATWIEEHFYETPAEDEASSYGVEFRLARS